MAGPGRIFPTAYLRDDGAGGAMGPSDDRTKSERRVVPSPDGSPLGPGGCRRLMSCRGPAFRDPAGFRMLGDQDRRSPAAPR